MNERSDVTDAGAEIVEIASPRECAALARVLADVWGLTEASAVIPADALRAIAHSGGYVVGVAIDDRLVGGGVGWLARVDGELRLHSHVVGLLDGYRTLGLGGKVKLHQREFARASGLAAVEWTYDPLHAANAQFNLAKLGARVVSFHRDFYGELPDVFNAGLGSDRFLVRWSVDGPPASTRPTALAADLPRETILRPDADGSPLTRSTDAQRLLAGLPRSIVEIRSTDPELALRWRRTFASTVGALVESGASITGFVRDVGYLIDR